MLPRAHLILAISMFIALAVAIPALAQVEPSATGGSGGSTDESEMMTPPPASGMSYASGAGSEERSNYLETNVAASAGYINNFIPNPTGAGTNTATVTVSPNVTFDRSAPRRKEQFSYSPNFLFYFDTGSAPAGSPSASSFDSFDQNAAASFQYRFNPRLAFSLVDGFVRTSNVFDSSYVFPGAVTGSTQTPQPTVIAPFSEQITNIAAGNLSYQYGRNGMIGGGVDSTIFELPNPASAEGLYNSNGIGGSVFYNRRLSRSQYFGLNYAYARIVATNDVSETQTHVLLPFYTLYFSQNFSFSISAGIEHVNTTAIQEPTTTSWAPTISASIGWQGARGSCAASFTRIASAGGGLLGAYDSKSFNASGTRKLSRAWTGDVSAGYSSINSITPLTASNVIGGNTLTAGAILDHPIGERFSIQFQYQHFHEDYNGTTAIATDSDHASATLTYHLSRPLGR
jgi:hypothetical protein